MKKFVKIVNPIIYVITILTIIASLLLIIPRFSGIYPFVVNTDTGGVLAPYGSVVYVDTNNNIPATDDAVVFENMDASDSLSVQKCIGSNDYGFLVQKSSVSGGAITTVVASQIIGSVKYIIPQVGRVLKHLPGKTVLYAVAGQMVLCLIAAFVHLKLLKKDSKDTIESTPKD